MSEEFKPLETFYNGYRFRSRLEARWAVFFDAVRLDYEYEPEGFDLKERWYLPDFYLRDLDLYVEVKPLDVKMFKQYDHLGQLFQEYTPYSLLIVIGDPYIRLWNWLYAYDTCDSGGGQQCSYAFIGEYNGEVKLIVNDGRPDRTYFTRDFSEGLNELNCYNASSEEFFEDTFQTIEIKKAALKARQARFEHGECG